MMNCTKCGAQNSDGANFCQNCGSQLTATTTSVPTPATTSIPTLQPTPSTQKTSGSAVASLVLGIIGLFMLIPAILAIVFGGVALSQMRKDPTLGGHGLAVTGLVLGIVTIAVWLLVVLFIILGSVAVMTI
jgi:hypothetical protein